MSAQTAKLDEKKLDEKRRRRWRSVMSAGQR